MKKRIFFLSITKYYRLHLGEIAKILGWEVGDLLMATVEGNKLILVKIDPSKIKNVIMEVKENEP